MYIYSNKLGELTKIGQPENLRKLIHNADAGIEHIKNQKQYAYDHGTITSRGRQYGAMGEAGMWVGEFPKAFLQAILRVDPDVVRDDHKWNKLISEYPMYNPRAIK